jgi:Tfp pilus assembly protein PilO
LDNDTYALEQLKLQETYWMERDRVANLALVREQIANVEARIADRLRLAEAA